MRKSARLIKRLVALLLVLLLSIESFGAVVSDNDGSAFITKAEFDSLKNDFQAQIDQYNTSIDMKIDGAIAAYLAGIKMSRKSDVPVIVTNYNEIKWKRKFDFYGSYADYTSGTSKTVQKNVWYTPHFQQYLGFRGTQHDTMFQWNRWYSGFQVGLRYLLDCWSLSNAALTYSDPYDSSMRVPWTTVLACNYDYEDEIVLGGRSDGEYLLCNSGMDQYHGANPIVGSGPSLWTGSGWRDNPNNYYALAPITEAGETTMGWPLFENIDVSSMADGVIGFRIYCNYENKRNSWAKLEGQWDIRNVNPAYCVLQYSWDSRQKDNVESAINLTNWAPNTFSKLGGHLYNDYIASGYGQGSSIPNTMFGDDIDLTVNIIRQSNVSVGRTRQVRTTYSDWVTIPCTVQAIYIGGVFPWTLDNGASRTGLESKGYTFSLKYPYFERYPLNKITSAKFKNNGVNLKYGEGLPISTYLNGNGTLTIQFDYEIGRTAQTVASGEDKRIKVDVKKTSFLSGVDDYYSGKIDGSSTAVTLKNAASGSNSSQKSKIVIENVKEGESVWIRIAPYSTTAGLYAQMSNLTANIESEE